MTGTTFVLPAAVQETLQIFWESPFPATLQDEQFRLVDVTPRRVRPRYRAGFAAGATAGSRRQRQAWPEL
jgi:hypothetical protein